MLGDVLWWWTRQMRALLPHGLLPEGGGEDALVVSVAGTRERPVLQLALRRRQGQTLLGHFAIDEFDRRAASPALRRRARHVVLQPDPASILERQVQLPLAVERDVAEVVRYDMDRLTPFTADQVYWSATTQHRDRSAGRLLLSLVLVPKRFVQPVLAALERVGLTVGSVEAITASGALRRINVAGRPAGHGVWLKAALLTIAALALAAVVTPFITQSLARGRVEQHIAALQPRLKQVEALRQRIAAGTAGADLITTEQARLGDVMQVLATVTDLLPDDTVLSDLTLRQGKLEISGRSTAAARLIPAMAADPIVHSAAFVAPVTRTPDGKADTFVIRAEVGP
jgi:general secretion pathway protein L